MKQLLLMLVGALIALPALALEFEYTYEGQTLKYSTTSDTEVAVANNRDLDISGDVIIPASVNYYGTEYQVTSIANSAFHGCTNLTSVSISNTITLIGESAFEDCTGLTSVTIPNSVIEIDEFAFCKCTSLTSVTIPNSVVSIGKCAFYGCSSLMSFVLEDENNIFCSIDGVLFNKEKTTLLLYPAGKSGDYTIPSSVTSIGQRAFQVCSGLTSVIIPNSVTEIGEDAFYCCTGLTSSIIPNSVTSIGESAFYGCTGLTSIAIPNSVTEIGEGAFSECTGLTSVTIPNSVTVIGEYVFYGCIGLTTVTIPDSVTEIGGRAFYGCSGLTSVTIPGSVTSIGSGAFRDCISLTSVYYNTEEPIEGSSDIFYGGWDYDIYKNATLYVPEATVEKCKEIEPWKYFENIKAYRFSGIEDVDVDIDMDAPYDVYTIGGQRAGSSVDGLAPDIYIVRQGSAVKKIAIK